MTALGRVYCSSGQITRYRCVYQVCVGEGGQVALLVTCWEMCVGGIRRNIRTGRPNKWHFSSRRINTRIHTRHIEFSCNSVPIFQRINVHRQGIEIWLKISMCISHARICKVPPNIHLTNLTQEPVHYGIFSFGFLENTASVRVSQLNSNPTMWRNRIVNPRNNDGLLRHVLQSIRLGERCGSLRQAASYTP